MHYQTPIRKRLEAWMLAVVMTFCSINPAVSAQEVFVEETAVEADLKTDTSETLPAPESSEENKPEEALTGKETETATREAGTDTAGNGQESFTAGMENTRETDTQIQDESVSEPVTENTSVSENTGEEKDTDNTLRETENSGEQSTETQTADSADEPETEILTNCLFAMYDNMEIAVSSEQEVFPVSAVLRIQPINPETAEQMVVSELDLSAKDNPVIHTAFDVSVEYGGEILQPSAFGCDDVSVTIGNIPEIPDEVSVLHVQKDVLDENGDIDDSLLTAIPEEIRNEDVKTQLVSDIPGPGQEISFDTSSLSPVVVFTVEFTYEGYSYVMNGEESVLLSHLAEELSLPFGIRDVSDAVFDDPSLVSVEKADGDYVLTSLRPFDTEQLLSITLINGNTYEITVTDDNESEVYAILYTNGDLVIQNGDTPDESHGSVENTFTGFITRKGDPSTAWGSYKSKVVRFYIDDEIHPYTIAYWFYNYPNLISISGLENIKTDLLENATRAFENIPKITELNLCGMELHNVVTKGLFQNNPALKKVSNIKITYDRDVNANAIFNGCPVLEEADISDWRFTGVKDLSYMFNDCKKLTAIDISDWGADSVTNLYYAFRNCNLVETLDFSGWNLGAVTDIGSCFEVNSKLKELNLGTMNAENISMNSYTFTRDNNLEKITLPGNFRFRNGCVLPDGVWFEESNPAGMYSSAELAAIQDGTMAGTWVKRNIIAVLYSDGELVIQNETDETDSSREIVATYQNLEANNGSQPWSAHATDITSVTVNTGFYPKSMANWFKGCSNLTTVNNAHLIDTGKQTTSIQSMFEGCRKLESVDVSTWDTSKITSMATAFSQCEKLEALDVGGWNTSNVTNFGNTFNYCKKIENLDVGRWDISKATNLSSTFWHCEKLQTLDVSRWDTANVTNFSGTFGYCSVIDGLDVSGFNTSKATSMANMFDCSYGITGLDVSNFDTGNVTAMNSMFTGTKCETIDVSHFDTGKVKQMRYMFSGCTNLKTLDVSRWDTSSATEMNFMFQSCRSLENLDVSGWSVPNVTTMDRMFTDCTSLQNIDVSNWTVPKVTNMNSMFQNCDSFTSLDLSAWAPARTANFNSFCNDLDNITEIIIDPDTFNTSSATNMTTMFAKCPKLETVDVSGFNMDKVTTIHQMFNGDFALKELDVKNWSMSSCTSVQDAFQDCSVITSLDLTGWKPSKVTNFQGLFCRCSGLSDIVFDTTGFDTSAAKNMSYMFADCASIKELDLSFFSTPLLERTNYMFSGCRSLENLDISGISTLKAGRLEKTFNVNPALQRVVLGENWKFRGNTTNSGYWSVLPGTQWMRESTGEMYKPEDLRDSYDGTTMADVYLNRSVSAILYESGELVFQYGSQPDPAKGPVTATYTGFDNSTATTPMWNAKKGQILKVSVEAEIHPLSMQNWFNGCTGLSIFNGAENIRTDRTVNLQETFRNCSALTELDLSTWDTSRVKNLNSTFKGCGALETLNVSDWNTSAVTNMQETFSGIGVTELDVSDWDTSGVTNMYATFSSCGEIESLDLSGWDTSKVTTMAWMFSGARGLTELNLSGWNTSNVTTMEGMFNSAASLHEIDVSSFNFEKTANMSKFMYDCSKLKRVKMPQSAPAPAVKTMWAAFSKCTDLESLDISGFITGPALTNISAMFEYDDSLKNVDITGLDTSGVTTAQSIFRLCPSLVSVDLSNMDMTKTNMTSFFTGNSSLSRVVLGDRWKKFNIDPPNGNWMNLETGVSLTRDRLFKNYDPATMTGTWVRLRNINFNANGGYPALQTISTYLGDSTDREFTVSRTGYDFLGWFTEPDGGEEYHTGDAFTVTDYYAHWNPHRYTLVLNANGGHPEEDVVVELGYSDFYKLSRNLFTKDGEVIRSWNTRANGKGTGYGAEDEIVSITKADGATVTLFAIWGVPPVTVSFNTCGGEPMLPVEKDPGRPVGSLGEAVKEGYAFEGWYLDEDLTDRITEDYIPEDDITLYAGYLKNPVITYDSDGGTPETKTVEVKYGKKIGAFESFTNGTAVIVRWEYPDGSQAAVDDTVTEDITLKAVWGHRPKFHTNGGTFKELKEYPLREGEEYHIETLPEVERYGYTFDGWYTSDGTLVEEGMTVVLTDSCDITAKWIQKEIHTVTLDADGGKFPDKTTSKTVKVYDGEKAGELPTPEKNGYTFAGWFDGDGSPYSEGSVIDGDVSLIPVWLENSVTLTFDSQGGSSAKPGTISVPENSTLESLPGSSKPNRTLNGWYTEPGGQGEKLTTDTVLTESRTYYAFWEEELHTVDNGNLTYKYGISWSNPSDASATNEGSHLNLHPTDQTDVGAMMHIRFEVTESVDETKMPVGSVAIHIPKSVFEDWDGNRLVYDNISMSIPLAPDSRDGMFFNYYETDDEYVLVNCEEIASGYGVDVVVAYWADVWEIPGGAYDENGNVDEAYEYYTNDSIPVRFEIDSDLNGENEIDEEQTLSLEYHTQVDSAQSKSYHTAYYKWNRAWGPKPEDADDYFYIAWKVVESTTTKTNQPYTVEWSEDTVSDGTVVKIPEVSREYRQSLTTYGDTTKEVIMKYPLSLIKSSVDGWITLRNEAIVTEHWKSGKDTPHRVSATARIFVTGTGGAGTGFTKYIPQYYIHEAHFKYGGQEDIIDENTPVKMEYTLGYSGRHNNTIVWDSEEERYIAPLRTITITDGDPGDVMISSALDKTMYNWVPDNGNVSLSDTDYSFESIRISLTEYDSVMYGTTWIPPQENTVRSRYGPVEVYLRSENEPDYYLYKTVDLESNNKMLELPEKTVGFRLVHKTDYYSTGLSATAVLSLKPSEKVKTLIQNDITAGIDTIVKNAADCEVHAEGTKVYSGTNRKTAASSAWNSAYELNVSETTLYAYKQCASREKTTYDTNLAIQTTDVYIAGWNFNPAGRYKVMRSGTFYDLLPYGTFVDENTVFAVPHYKNETPDGKNHADKYDEMSESGDRLENGNLDIRFVENWESSGRTMMIVKAANPESVRAVGFDIYYRLQTTYENLLENGLNLENDVAFVNTTANRVPPTYLNQGSQVIEEKQYFESLENSNHGNIAFAEDSTSYLLISAFSWGFTKRVKTKSSYEKEDVTLLNNIYTYKLTYSQSDKSTTDKIVFYDVLEAGGDSRASEWEGTFESVDCSSMAKKYTNGSTTLKCSPVVYYSTKPKSEFTDDDLNVENSDVWTTEMPSDKTEVTAVAVDCSWCSDGSRFVLKGAQSASIHINMRAPKDGELVDKTTVNKATLVTRPFVGTGSSSAPDVVGYSESSVILRDMDVEIHKTSFPESGTADNPEGVVRNSTITYTIAITNRDNDFTVHDVVVTDPVPDGLVVKENDARIHFGNPENSLLISESPRSMEFTCTGNTTTFEISSILAGETVYLMIPAVVSVKEGTFVNTATLETVNEVPVGMKTETTYHDVIPVRAKILKTGITGTALEGAVLQVLDKNGEPVKEFTSSNLTEEFEIDPGTYTLHEVSPPEGYRVAEDIEFEIDIEGIMYIGDRQVSKVVMTDVPLFSRAIEGTVWNDGPSVSADGKRTAGEETYQGVTVKLYRMPDNPEDPVSEPVDETTTDRNGHYVFENVGQGTFFVVIEREGVPTAKDKAGVPHTENSNAETYDGVPGKSYLAIKESEVAGTVVPGIYMPTMEELIEGTTYVSGEDYVYRQSNLDAGYVKPCHNLTVTKTVEGNFGDRSRAFAFELRLDRKANPDVEIPETVTGKKGEKTETYSVSDGRVPFTLAHGESIIFIGLPEGINYEVTENPLNYTQTKSNEKGVLTGNTTALFVNRLDTVVPTGSHHNYILLLLMISAVIIILITAVIRNRKRRHTG